MSVATIGRLEFPSAEPRGLAFSQEALTLRAVLEEDVNLLGTITKLGQRLREAKIELSKVCAEASEDDWDGERSAAVEPSTARFAQSLLSILVRHFDVTPEIDADRDGEVLFSWDAEPRQVVTLSVGRDGTLSYAALIGDAKHHGQLAVRDCLPTEIIQLISRVEAHLHD